MSDPQRPASPLSVQIESFSPTLRRSGLRERLEALAEGRRLSQDEVIDTVLELLDDAQSTRPKLSADALAQHYGALARARAEMN